MALRLIDSGWDTLFRDALKADASALRVICPFIKHQTVDRLLADAAPGVLQVITRFDLNLYAAGVSDVAALRRLLDAGATVRGVRNVHAKLYLFGDAKAFVTSANLTDAAMFRNAEFGVAIDDAVATAGCRAYFDSLWTKAAGATLSVSQIDGFEATLAKAPKAASTATSLPDEGADLGLPREVVRAVPASLVDAPQAFVKFWGSGSRDRRLPPWTPVIDEMSDSGAHEACAYPKPPMRVRDGAVMFMGRMVHPTDIRIDGRAIARRHDRDRDVANAADIARRPWKKTYRYLIRVADAEFVDGNVGDGVSMNEMMDALGAKAFRSTSENEARGKGNVDPRLAYRRHAQVELSDAGYHWLNDRLDAAFRRHGTIAQHALAAIESKPLPTLPFGK